MLKKLDLKYTLICLRIIGNFSACFDSINIPDYGFDLFLILADGGILEIIQ